MPSEGKEALMSGGGERNTCVKWRRREHLCQVEEKGTLVSSGGEGNTCVKLRRRGQ